MDMDSYLSRAIRNWAARHHPPKNGKARLLLIAAASSRPVEEPRLDLRNVNRFGRPLMDGAFGPVILANMYSFHMSITSLRMII